MILHCYDLIHKVKLSMNGKKLLLVIISVLWNYWLSLIVLWIFIAMGVIHFKVRVLDAEVFAYSNCIILFCVNLLLCLLKINKKKIFILSFLYFIVLFIGLFVLGFKVRYIPLVYACFSVFTLNGLCLFVVWRLYRKISRN